MTAIDTTLILIAWAVAAGSPGPATLAIAGTSMNRGRAQGLAVATGITCGSATWGLAATLGLSAIMTANAWMFEVLRYIGAAYLLFLAFKALRSAVSDKPMMPLQATTGPIRQQFVKGLLIHLTNPKAVLGWGAGFTLVAPQNGGFAALFEAYCMLLAVSCCVFLGYAVLFSTAGFARAYTRARRWFEGTFAVLFGFAGFKILTAKLT